jgi:hypothetical protein
MRRSLARRLLTGRLAARRLVARRPLTGRFAARGFLARRLPARGLLTGRFAARGFLARRLPARGLLTGRFAARGLLTRRFAARGLLARLARNGAPAVSAALLAAAALASLAVAAIVRDRDDAGRFDDGRLREKAHIEQLIDESVLGSDGGSGGQQACRQRHDLLKHLSPSTTPSVRAKKRSQKNERAAFALLAVRIRFGRGCSPTNLEDYRCCPKDTPLSILDQSHKTYY